MSRKVRCMPVRGLCGAIELLLQTCRISKIANKLYFWTFASFAPKQPRLALESARMALRYVRTLLRSVFMHKLTRFDRNCARANFLGSASSEAQFKGHSREKVDNIPFDSQ